MLTNIDEWEALKPDERLARVNDIERDNNMLRRFVGEPLEPLEITPADEWKRLTPMMQYGLLIELEMNRNNLRDYLRAFYHGRAQTTETCAA